MRIGWCQVDQFLSCGQFFLDQICVFRPGAVSDDQDQIVDRAWEWENVKRETFAQLSRKLSINAMQVEQNRALLFGCNEMLFVPYLADDKNIFRWHWNEFQISSLNIYPGPRITAVFLSQCPCPPITILAVNHQPNNWITSS